jgi:hypothetical protein
MNEVDHEVPVEISEKPKKHKKARKSRRKELAGFSA